MEDDEWLSIVPFKKYSNSECTRETSAAEEAIGDDRDTPTELQNWQVLAAVVVVANGRT